METIKEKSSADQQNGLKINMSQAKNIDQVDKINQTIGIIGLSRAAMAKVEKTKDRWNRTAGIKKGWNNSRETSQYLLPNGERCIDKGSDSISKQTSINKNALETKYTWLELDVLFFSVTMDVQIVEIL